MNSDISKFTGGNRIQNIKREMVQEGKLAKSKVSQSLPDTRMYLACLVIESALAQQPFLAQLMQYPKFKDYLNSRGTNKKTEIEDMLKTWNYDLWMRMEKVIKLLSPFRQANKIVSREKTPMSVALPLVQALRNEVTNAVDDDEFDLVLGATASMDVMDMLNCRFNMNGAKPSGTRKVGILDPYQIWCFLVDPFSSLLRNQVKIEGGIRHHAKSMISHFVPDSEEGAEETRRLLLIEFEVRCFDHTYLSHLCF